MAIQVCMGAMLQCSFGVAPSTLVSAFTLKRGAASIGAPATVTDWPWPPVSEAPGWPTP